MTPQFTPRQPIDRPTARPLGRPLGRPTLLQHVLRWLLPATIALAVFAVILVATGTVTATRSADGGMLPRVTISPNGGDGSTVGESDGRLPEDGARPDQTDLPGLANLDGDLLAAVQRATADAERDGITVRINSGWRTRAYQEDLFERGITKYGSREEAARFVAKPETSQHVTGKAVDVGPTDASYWFASNGSDYGLCQTYANEVWHYELSTTPGGTCPAMKDGAS